MAQFSEISFEEIFDSSNIDSCTYYVVALNPYQYSSEGIHTIFWEKEYVVNSYIEYNNKRTIYFNYESPYIKGYLISVYVRFKYKDSDEEHLVSYDPFYYTHYTQRQYTYFQKKLE